MRDVPRSSGGHRKGSLRFPEIVPIVLREAARLRGEGDLSQGEFEEKLTRICAEELAPLNLELLVRELDDGITRFLIRESRSGQVREMIDCGTSHSVGDQLPPADSMGEAQAIPWRDCAPVR